LETTKIVGEEAVVEGVVKMCEYCQEDKQLIKTDVATAAFETFTGYEEMQIIIDRGYLRFGFTDDMQCMDHGEKIKINFCPMCGESLQKKDGQ
jgi:hypothetical protein